MTENMRDPTIINMPTIKPLDKELLLKIAQTHDIILTCEEHSVIGGLGSAVCEYLSEYNLCKIIRIGVQDSFGESGTPQALMEKHGLSADKLADFIKNFYNEER